MTKQDVKLEEFLTVISPSQVVRIMDDEKSADGNGDPDEMTLFRGTAAKAFREYAGKGFLLKHVSPELEKETAVAAPRYIMHIYIYT